MTKRPPEPSEKSSGGQPVYRYTKRADFQSTSGDEKLLKAVEKHVESNIAPISWIFHEIISDQVHIDVLFVEPSATRPFTTVVSCGMSQKPMSVVPGAEDFRFAELVLALPPDWPLSEEAFQKEENYWPIRWMKTLARLPHEYGSWLSWAHTIPNGDPARPFARDTELCGWILGIPVLFPEAFFELRDGSKKIRFFSMLPLYREEMDFKLANDADQLFERLDKIGVTELLDPKRKNGCKRGLGLF